MSPIKVARGGCELSITIHHPLLPECRHSVTIHALPDCDGLHPFKPLDKNNLSSVRLLLLVALRK